MVHRLDGKKIHSEYYNSGRKTHSAEVELEVALSLLQGVAGDHKNKLSPDQTAEDDNNFWKNPVNQTDQIKFNEEMAPKPKRHGGHITLEEVASGCKQACSA